MAALEIIEKEIMQLSEKELSKFRKWFAELPAEIQRHARQNYALLKKNPTHPSHCILSWSLTADFAVFVSAFITGHLVFRYRKAFNGFGSEIMTNMTGY